MSSTAAAINAPFSNLQTTVLFGGSNGTATLCSLLGDKSNPHNNGHVIRVVTRHPDRFMVGNADATSPTAEAGRPREWRCNEQKAISDVIPTSFLPTSWVTHVGAPHSVFGYDNDDSPNDNNNGIDNNVEIPLTSIERAISGIQCHDDGGAANILTLACPVHAHFDILRQIARALYRLNTRYWSDSIKSGDGCQMMMSTKCRLQKFQHHFQQQQQPTLFIGSLYAAGNFDWMCRAAFAIECPSYSITNSRNSSTNEFPWYRPLALFGLRSFPFLCKKNVDMTATPTTANDTSSNVTLYGRYPVLGVVCCPANTHIRQECRRILGRVLQIDDKYHGGGGKTFTFLGLSGSIADGGADAFSVNGNNGIATHGSRGDKEAFRFQVQQQQQHDSLTPLDKALLPPLLMSDLSDPYSSLGFLSCTLNATNQLLHPCIMAALFAKSDCNGMGIIDDWNVPNGGGDSSNKSANCAPTSNNSIISNGEEKTRQQETGHSLWWHRRQRRGRWSKRSITTPVPRFYADGAALPEAGRLIVSIAVGEFYPLMVIIDTLLSPNGLLPISAQHGGEPVGRFVLSKIGNHPVHVGERSKVVNDVLCRLLRRNGEQKVDGYPPTGYNDNSIHNSSMAHKVKYIRILSKIMSMGLSQNTRLGSVLSPAIKDETTGTIRPNVNTRFFIDDIPHGLCVALGLAELVGMDLERDMHETLILVRKLQHWMKKEYVRPFTVCGEEGVGSSSRRNATIVSGARDLAETSAPQALGVHTLGELRAFLQQSPFGGDGGHMMQMSVLMNSPMMQKAQGYIHVNGSRAKMKRLTMMSRL